MNIPGIGASAATDNTLTTPTSQQNTDNIFLKLLTTQLQNQSPLDPVDPNQFASQLVQFNMLDQLIQINQTLQGAATADGKSSSSVQGAQ